ncbi:MAG: hypothetical protein OXI33_06625 [Chloroflexota bacterium]|nr:hypothetical protein [Chloroflexota bacterium]
MDNSIPEAFIFMKVGWHGGDSLKDILNRKKIELKEAEMIFWGYGGTVLHPTNQVQRFVKGWKEKIEVLMQVVESNSGSGPPAGTAKQFAVSDKELWKRIPKGIKTGGKHALVLDEIRECKLELDLRDYEVGIGPSSKGKKNAADYLSYRTDKGALVKAKPPQNRPKEPKRVLIKYRAYLKHPYAVFLWPLKK